MYYRQKLDEVMNSLKSSPEGLSAEEAEKRLSENGKNRLEEGEKESLLHRFAKQLADPMIIILIAAAVVSGITAAYAGESFADVIIIGIVVVINAVLGVYQESKAEKAIEALQEMSSSTSKVIRSGRIENIKSEDLVVGDVVVLEAGDAVPADCRIIESASLKCEESALTGESVPVDKKASDLTVEEGKDIPLGDRTNMMYMGCSVVYGRARAVVTAAGMDTEMGKIADALHQAKEGKTPLQIKLAHLSKILSYAVIGICIFIFGFSLIKAGSLSGAVIIDTFMIAVSLAVAAIPEGLATVVTIVLSIGVTNMSKRNAVIRKLTAVETLGCAQIICSDKTGTLTQNRMTVVDHYGENENLLASGMALCSDAELNGDGTVVGEPTECALVNYAKDKGFEKKYLKEQMPRVGEAPFDSDRKMMSTVHQSSEGLIQYTKGAPDEILKRCDFVYRDGRALPMTEELRDEIYEENRRMADKALRVLALAMRRWDKMPENTDPEYLEKELVFVGLTGMIDPVRPEVLDAIEECRTAGIKPVMITGDHIDTAAAIAMELGIITDKSQAITGNRLNEISDDELNRRITEFGVYARVQPEHKVRIVNAWKNNGYITAMTGDGVNDAPSIKSADIGVGMGITGTDVTKNVADMVLADDNFATIIHAVEEGRRIYDNIRKSIQFLLASNLSEVLCIFTATLMGFVILKPVHLLWVNLITDTFPALALGMEAAEPDIMKRKPRSPKESIFSGGLGFDLVYQGILVSVLVLLSYFIGHFVESGVWEITQSADGMTMAFLTLSMVEIFHSFNMRSQRKSLFSIKEQNLVLWGSGILSLILTTAVIYVPFLADAFSFEHISIGEYVIAIIIAFMIIPAVEAVKLFQRKRKE